MTEHTCTGCGQCCSSLLPVSETEIDTIKKYIKEHRIKPLQKLGPLDCPFFDGSRGNRKCIIYPVRPLICREFYCDFIKINPEELRQARKLVNMQEVF